MAFTNNQIKNTLIIFRNNLEQSISSPTDEKVELLNEIETYIQDYENSLYQTLKRDRFMRKIKKNVRLLKKMIYIDNIINESGYLSREQIIDIANQWELMN